VTLPATDTDTLLALLLYCPLTLPSLSRHFVLLLVLPVWHEKGKATSVETDSVWAPPHVLKTTIYTQDMVGVFYSRPSSSGLFYQKFGEVWSLNHFPNNLEVGATTWYWYRYTIVLFGSRNARQQRQSSCVCFVRYDGLMRTERPIS